MNIDLHVFDSTASTNLLVRKAIAQGAGEGWTAHAYTQTAGHGRNERRWHSPSGGLYLSVLLRPDVDARELPTLTLAAAVAMRRAACALGCGQAQIKWPNDIILGCNAEGKLRKLCGISAERVSGAVCLGIGMNIVSFGPVPDLGDDPQVAAYVEQGVCATDGRAQVDHARDVVLTALDEVYGDWLAGGFAAVAERYRAADYLAGKHVCILGADGEEMVRGEALGVNDDATLAVRDEVGEVHAIVSGEAHVRFASEE